LNPADFSFHPPEKKRFQDFINHEISGVDENDNLLRSRVPRPTVFFVRPPCNTQICSFFRNSYRLNPAKLLFIQLTGSVVDTVE
jgi:hypothetical protein